MKSRNTLRFLLLVAGLAAVVGIWYRMQPRDAAPVPAPSLAKPTPRVAEPTAIPPATGSAPAPTAVARTAGESPAATPALPPTPSATAAVPAAQPTPAALATPEEVATERMITAHAPLRTPAVADPDSPENRKALQTMLLKALARKEAAPSTK